MLRFAMTALALLALPATALAVANIGQHDPRPEVLVPQHECDANGCYVEVCLKEECFRVRVPTAVCFNVANAPYSFTVAVGNPTRPGGCTIHRQDFSLP